MTLAEARSGAGGFGQKSTAASADLGIRLCLALVALLLLFRVLLAATADLSEDEAYYWLWSTHLAAGYYDHPPMIAYWIRAGTAVFGQTGFRRALRRSLKLAGRLLFALSREPEPVPRPECCAARRAMAECDAVL